jgi:hypothetical protein
MQNIFSFLLFSSVAWGLWRPVSSGSTVGPITTTSDKGRVAWTWIKSSISILPTVLACDNIIRQASCRRPSFCAPREHVLYLIVAISRARKQSIGSYAATTRLVRCTKIQQLDDPAQVCASSFQANKPSSQISNCAVIPLESGTTTIHPLGPSSTLATASLSPNHTLRLW